MHDVVLVVGNDEQLLHPFLTFSNQFFGITLFVCIYSSVHSYFHIHTYIIVIFSQSEALSLMREKGFHLATMVER